MKKIILILSAISLLAFLVILSITQSKKNPALVISLKDSVLPVKDNQEAKPKTTTTAPSIKTESLPQEPAQALFEEFNLPQDLQTQLDQAASNGSLSNEWGEGSISKDELKEAGLAPGQISAFASDKKIKNITAGYSLSDKTFNENLNLCLPDKTIVEDEQTKELKSQALSAMGFAALMEHKYPQAEEAFSALIRDYPDTPAAPVAHLELARIFSQDGRFAEAEQLLNKAASLYNNDQDYLTIAQALKDEMKSNE